MKVGGFDSRPPTSSYRRREPRVGAERSSFYIPGCGLSYKLNRVSPDIPGVPVASDRRPGRTTAGHADYEHEKPVDVVTSDRPGRRDAVDRETADALLEARPRFDDGDSSSGRATPSPPRPAPGANCAAPTTGTRKARDLGHRSTASAWTCASRCRRRRTRCLSGRTGATSRGSSPRSRPRDPDLTRSQLTGPSTRRSRRRPHCRRGSRRGRPSPTTRGAAGFPVDERHVDPSFELAELRSIATRRSHPDGISGPPATQCRSVPPMSDLSARD